MSVGLLPIRYLSGLSRDFEKSPLKWDVSAPGCAGCMRLLTAWLPARCRERLAIFTRVFYRRAGAVVANQSQNIRLNVHFVLDSRWVLYSVSLTETRLVLNEVLNKL